MLHWHHTVNASLNSAHECACSYLLCSCVLSNFFKSLLCIQFFSENLGTHDLCANMPKNYWNRFSKIALKFFGKFFENFKSESYLCPQVSSSLRYIVTQQWATLQWPCQRQHFIIYIQSPRRQCNSSGGVYTI